MKNLTPIIVIIIAVLFASCNDTVIPNEINIVQELIDEHSLTKPNTLAILNPPKVERGIVFSSVEDGHITHIGRIIGQTTDYRVFDVDAQAIIQEVTIPNLGLENKIELNTPIPIEAGKKYIISSNARNSYPLDNGSDFLPYIKDGLILEKICFKQGTEGTFPDENCKLDIIYGVPFFIFLPSN